MTNYNVLKKPLDETFKFKIGDKVVLRSFLDACKLELEFNGAHDFGRIGGPLSLTVVERQINECHGGVQGTYTIHGVGGPKGEIVFMRGITELDLAPYEELVDVYRQMAPKKKK